MVRLLFFLSIFLYCLLLQHSKRSNTIISFNINTIDSIIVVKKPYSVSSHYPKKKLTKLQTNDFVLQLKTASDIGFRKMGGEYIFHVYGDSIRTVMTNGDLLKIKKEKGDWTYSISDTSYFGKLYNEAKDIS